MVDCLSQSRQELKYVSVVVQESALYDVGVELRPCLLVNAFVEVTFVLVKRQFTNFNIEWRYAYVCLSLLFRSPEHNILKHHILQPQHGLVAITNVAVTLDWVQNAFVEVAVVSHWWVITADALALLRSKIPTQR